MKAMVKKLLHCKHVPILYNIVQCLDLQPPILHCKQRSNKKLQFSLVSRRLLGNLDDASLQ